MRWEVSRNLGRLTQWIKWLLFAPFIKEAGVILEQPADIAPDMGKESENRDGYLQYRENGLQLRMSLKEGDTSVGNSRHADCVVDYPALSAKHAVITRRGETYSIKNVSSKEDTYVNGVLLPNGKEEPIQAGAIICLAGLQMQFQRLKQGA